MNTTAPTLRKEAPVFVFLGGIFVSVFKKSEYAGGNVWQLPAMICYRETLFDRKTPRESLLMEFAVLLEKHLTYSMRLPRLFQRLAMTQKSVFDKKEIILPGSILRHSETFDFWGPDTQYAYWGKDEHPMRQRRTR